MATNLIRFEVKNVCALVVCLFAAPMPPQQLTQLHDSNQQQQLGMLLTDRRLIFTATHCRRHTNCQLVCLFDSHQLIKTHRRHFISRYLLRQALARKWAHMRTHTHTLTCLRHNGLFTWALCKRVPVRLSWESAGLISRRVQTEHSMNNVGPQKKKKQKTNNKKKRRNRKTDNNNNNKQANETQQFSSKLCH